MRFALGGLTLNYKGVTPGMSATPSNGRVSGLNGANPRGSGFFEKLRHLAELVVAQVRQLVLRVGAEFRQVLLQGTGETCGRRIIVEVCSARRLRDDLVDNT